MALSVRSPRTVSRPTPTAAPAQPARRKTSCPRSNVHFRCASTIMAFEARPGRIMITTASATLVNDATMGTASTGNTLAHGPERDGSQGQRDKQGIVERPFHAQDEAALKCVRRGSVGDWIIRVAPEGSTGKRSIHDMSPGKRWVSRHVNHCTCAVAAGNKPWPHPMPAQNYTRFRSYGL